VVKLNGPLATLELRNTLNLAIARKRITPADRDALWRQFETQIRTGFFAETAIPATELHVEARRLSDRYTPTLARSICCTWEPRFCLAHESSIASTSDNGARRRARD
jgi:hypothetical protein